MTHFSATEWLYFIGVLNMIEMERLRQEKLW